MTSVHIPTMLRHCVDAEEVDALKQRLQIAELVMRKLYKRIIQLENQISNTRNHTDDQRLTTSTTDEKKY